MSESRVSCYETPTPESFGGENSFLRQNGSENNFGGALASLRRMLVVVEPSSYWRVLQEEQRLRETRRAI